MTSKPDSVSTLEYHWTDRTGRPLEPQVHWDATGTTLADASTQWCSSGDPVLICIIGTHWKTTWKPLEDHWKHTGISPVAFQCTLGSKFQAHWIASGRPLAQGKGNITYEVKTDGHIISLSRSLTYHLGSPFNSFTSMRIKAWINKYFLVKTWDVITHSPLQGRFD